MKKLIFILFIFLSSQSFSQLSNLDFEEWDSVVVQNDCCQEVPKGWKYNEWNEPFVQKSDFAHSGNWSIGLDGSVSGFDNPIPSFVQQKFRVPTGLDSISANVVVLNGTNFCGFGLTRDTLPYYTFFQFKPLEVGWCSTATIPEYQRVGFAVPDSLWGEEMYLTAYSLSLIHI